MDARQAKLEADKANNLPAQFEYSTLLNNIKTTAQGGNYSFIFNGILTDYTLNNLALTGFTVSVVSNVTTISWS